jgi:uncharacterized protein (TIGR02466 family)
MRKSLNIFETLIFSVDCDIDNELIFNETQNHFKSEKGVILSNNGGYQGHNFSSETLFQQIRNNIPQRDDRKIIDFSIQAWLNINYENSWNDIHMHIDSGVFLSGVYYVKVPKNCGNIRLYDPRFLKGKNLYDSYYFSDRGDYLSIVPEEKMMIFFPPWLPHMVEPNRSKEERISIAFNIFDPIFRN